MTDRGISQKVAIAALVLLVGLAAGAGVTVQRRPARAPWDSSPVAVYPRVPGPSAADEGDPESLATVLQSRQREAPKPPQASRTPSQRPVASPASPTHPPKAAGPRPL